MAGSDINDTVGRIRDLLLSQSKAGRLRSLLDSVYGSAPVSTPGMLGMQHQQTASQTDPALERYMAGKESATRGVPLEAPAFAPDDLIGSGLLKGMLGGGAALAGTFIGKSARTWDAVAMSQAQQMEKAGIDPRTIWKETGTWKGPDGNWRQEVADDTARLRFDFESMPRYKDTYLNKQVDVPIGGVLDHPELFRAYPEMLRNVRVSEIQRQPDWMPDSIASGGYRESYDPRLPAKIDVRAKTGETALNKLAHELQHDIQTARERGWARGGSESSAGGFDAYRRLAGEVEARATQARLPLNAAQRRALFPEDSYDVPISELIFKK